MDDHRHKFQVDPFTKALLPLIVLTVLCGAVSLILYTSYLAPKEQNASSDFNRLSATMRHNFKVGSLNHRAYDEYLGALLSSDFEQIENVEDYLNASIGFIRVGYINNDDLVKDVVPLVEEGIAFFSGTSITGAEDEIKRVRTLFRKIFWEIEQIEKNINVEIQKLYTRQQELRKKWQYFYLLITASAVLGALVITVLAFKQRALIASLKENDRKLRIQIGERKQAEAEKADLARKLFQAKKMESIGLMAGGVAHDLNNILAGIVGYPELMLRTLPQDSELRKPLIAIRDSGKRAALVVDDLLTVARGVASTKEHISLIEMVKEYLQSPEFENLCSLYPQITFDESFEAEAPWAYCSSVHVKKCIMNLVTNGAEAIADGGKVTISVVNEFLCQENKPSEPDNIEYAVIRVSDTGGGISESDINHVFDPFYSKKSMGRSGTGLGLTVVWNTMEEHDGKVLVDNMDSGTCFCLYFPVSRESGSDREISESEEIVQGNGEHILVVDDEEHLRELASAMLRSQNYVVDAVASGESAIEFLKEHSVDLVVLDMLMEPGMNGCRTYEAIIHLHPGQKAVVASGFSESEDVRKTMEMGASQYIKKPYSAHELGKAVQDTLRC